MAKGMYVGAGTEFPIYDEREVEVEVPVTKSFSIVNGNELYQFFDITQGEYTFDLNNTYWFTPTNLGIDNTEARITLTAKYDMSQLYFAYTSNSEPGYDELSIHRNGYLMQYCPEYDYTDEETEEEMFIYDGSFSTSLKKGDTIEIVFIKDGGYSVEDEYVDFGNISGKYKDIEIKTEIQSVQVGTEVVDVAREVKKQYKSVDGVARRIKSAYAEVNGVARRYFGGVAWEKYLCSMEEGGYELHDYYSSGWGSSGGDYFYPDYEFSSDSGFVMKGSSVYRKADGSRGDPNDIIGMYRKTYVSTEYHFDAPGYVLLQAVEVVDVGTLVIQCDAIGFAEEVEETYCPTGSSKGTFYASEGEIPEESGTLVAGSPNADYCVLNINGTLYYYEKRD